MAIPVIPVPPMAQNIHPASMMPVGTHSPILMEILRAPADSYWLLQYAMYAIREAVQPLDMIPHGQLAHYINYLGYIVQTTYLDMAALLVAITYASRCDGDWFEDVWPNSPRQAERIMIGALLTATKYTHESTYRLAQWANVSGFDTAELVLIERVFLGSIDFRLGLTEDDILNHREGIIGEESRPPHKYSARQYTGPPQRYPVHPLAVASPSSEGSNALPVHPVSPAAIGNDMEVDMEIDHEWCDEVQAEVESLCLYNAPSQWLSSRLEGPSPPIPEDNVLYITEDLQYPEYDDDDLYYGKVYEPLGARQDQSVAMPSYVDRYQTLEFATPPDSSRLPPIKMDWNPAPFSQTLPPLKEIFPSNVFFAPQR